MLNTNQRKLSLDSLMKTVVYYVSGHGFGHATRVCAVVRSLIERGVTVYVASQAPEHLFQQELVGTKDGSWFYRGIQGYPLDAGAHQKNPLFVCPTTTLRNAVDVDEKRSEVLEREACWMQSIDADVVLVDIAPLACAAAARAAVPSVIVGNFTWYDIYKPYVASAEGQMGFRSRSLLKQILSDYVNGCAALLRLPGHVGMDWAAKAGVEVIDVKMVVRQARSDRKEIREGLGVEETQKLAILTFGGHSADINLRTEALPGPDWVCFVCGLEADSDEGLPQGFRRVPAGSYLPDLILAADVAIGKLGYGVTSECLAYSTPIVYVSRQNFCEEPALAKLLRAHNACVQIPTEDFAACEWAQYLSIAFDLRSKIRCPPCDGASDVVKTVQIVLQKRFLCSAVDAFMEADDFVSTVQSFQDMLDACKLDSSAETFDPLSFFELLQHRLSLVPPHKKQFFKILNTRRKQAEYKERYLRSQRLLIVGCGPGGLRSAIEAALLGAQHISIVEPRPYFGRNNVLHLWPCTIRDLNNIGIKCFYKKFCSGSVTHISIRRLQLALLKISLVLGVRVHAPVRFEGLLSPPANTGCEPCAGGTAETGNGSVRIGSAGSG
eukprot:Rmarinus@m.14481